MVISAKGIISNWKIPIYFNFDTDMTAEVFFNAVNKLEEIGGAGPARQIVGLAVQIFSITTSATLREYQPNCEKL